VAWEPTSRVELIVPAGTGGGADQLARALQRLGATQGLLGQPLLVVNKSGGDGAEGLLHMKASARNPHKLLMALSNIFTTPRAGRISFSYRELTPVGMLALDDFVLWVNARSPYESARDFFDAVRAARDDTFSVGGTGLKQEDQLLTLAIQKQLGKKLRYIPFRGGGEVVAGLAEARSTCSLSNPLEALERWQSGALRPLCVFRAEPMPYSTKLPSGLAWSDIPTCKSAGIDIEYRMLRGVFLPSGVSPEVVAYYVDLLRRVRERPEWRAFLEAGALEDRFLVGPEFADWLARADTLHERWMRDAGLIAAPSPPQ
jgi:tripartite-type tricarboxylate transporter receptor subunit TctC